MVIAIVLAVEMKGLLIGEAPLDAVQQAIEQAITDSPQVKGIIHSRSMHLGPDDLLVAVKVEFDHHLSVAELAKAIDDTESAMRAAAPAAKTIYIEPDIRRQIDTP